jgi:hypothetical protein
MAGDMVKFEAALNQHMDYFVYGGVYLVVEKLRHLTLRNLIKKVSLVVKDEPSLQVNGQAHFIDLKVIFNILREWDAEMDLDELECLIANQIFLGYIKGYISHEKRLLVLGKVDPFPLNQE